MDAYLLLCLFLSTSDSTNNFTQCTLYARQVGNEIGVLHCIKLLFWG